MPVDTGSSHEIKNANGLAFENAVDAILPAMKGTDFVGILANGKMYRGSANNLGQNIGLRLSLLSGLFAGNS